MEERVIDHVALIELNSFLENIMQQIGECSPAKAVTLINSGEMVLSNIKTGWEEQDDMLSFSVISDGASGPQWLQRLKNKGTYVDEYVQAVLLSDDFKPTSGVETRVFILQGRKIKFFDNEAWRDERGLTELANGAEIACLAREKFSNQQISLMGIYIMAIGVGDLQFAINGHGRNCLCAFKRRMDVDYAYAFEAK